MHIFAGNDLIATVERAGTATTTHIIHTDHLGGTTAVTNADGDIVQAIDYYPYGSLRINDRNTTLDEGRKFTGHEYDIVPTLYYMRARYYDPSRGQFVSQDSAFWEEVERLLEDPQQLNSYSYARNNPLRYTDPDGRNVKEQLAKIQERINEIREQINALQIAIGNKAESAYQNNAVARAAMDHPYQAGAVIGVAGGGLVAGGVLAAGGSITCGIVCGGVAVSSIPIFSQTDKVAEGGQRLQKSLEVIGKDVNKINHVFQGKHALGQLAEKFGSSQNAMNEIVRAVDSKLPANYTGLYRTVVDVGGQAVTVTGRVVDGAVRIGTAFVKNSVR